ncbi:hypothetical protein EGM88_14715 [Aureibaculum marinum]|uniref:Uncharacterized protein n=1 Tax=Aureibaculum marinum TaxID=2487930 RepID=A0A3N4N975_9FLAO|nr:hypothetical protein [Aureibaculum marinum]RPD91618.1 hypothetical protein EGM88_14715 [Aureibaculum marinum]
MITTSEKPKTELNSYEAILLFNGLEQIKLGLKTLGYLNNMPNNEAKENYNNLKKAFKDLVNSI